jgi:enterochelin esterase-like enzyme
MDVPGLGAPRLVRIYVPKHARERDRPLLLLFDGQNVFDDAPSFAGGWHAHRAVERLAKNVSPPVVVGLDHGNERRIAELSPFPVGSHPARFHELFGWITGFLLQHLRHHFAITHDARRTVIGGSSMGGLAALHAHLARPDLFGGCIAMSPSLWVGRGAMFEWAHHHRPRHDARIYLDAGAREPAGMVRGAESMARLLAEHGARGLKVRIDPRGGHREIDWRRRLLGALRHTFGTSRDHPR